MNNLIRKNIQNLAPYESGYMEDMHNNILLNANENPYLPYPNNQLCIRTNRYYDENLFKLYEIFPDFYNAGKDDLIITKGSDEAIELLIKTFCEPNEDSVMIFSPTFSMYKFYADIQNAKTIDIPLILDNGVSLNMKEILKYEDNPPKIIFITNPQSPVGSALKNEDILKICKIFDKKSIIVIDEAYIEFSECKSFANILKDFLTVVVLRTLSKAYSMAGLRIGCCIAHKEITDTLKKVQSPYTISVKSTEIAVNALSLEGQKYAKENIKRIIQQKDIMYSELKNLSKVKKIFSSDTNFIFFKYNNIEKLKSECEKNNILLRFYKGDFKDFVRYTISTEKDNKILLNLLKELE